MSLSFVLLGIPAVAILEPTANPPRQPRAGKRRIVGASGAGSGPLDLDAGAAVGATGLAHHEGVL